MQLFVVVVLIVMLPAWRFLVLYTQQGSVGSLVTVITLLKKVSIFSTLACHILMTYAHTCVNAVSEN